MSSSSNDSGDRTVPESHVPHNVKVSSPPSSAPSSLASSAPSGVPNIHSHDTLAPDVSADDNVERIAQRWQDLHDEGKSASIEELCGNDYKLAGKVREFLAKVGKLEAILATQAPSADTLRGTYSKDDIFLPPQQPDELGRLGGFRMLKLIGQGGMGKVYLAEDVQLKRRVAIKVLLKGGDARFLRECQTLAKVDHDHIIGVYQIAKERDTDYLVMPYLQGETLEKRLKTLMRLPLPESIRIAKQIALGLAAANKVGIIHRDIKPSNVWLEAETDRVKILDFGLARDTDASNMLTQEGSVIGTPAFMAPEQAAGNPVDHRADLFSLGCCLYQMISGVSPFARKDVLSTLRALELETPELPTVRYPETPGPLSDLAMKLLSKKPEDRPESAQAVIDMLTAIEKGLDSPAAMSGIRIGVDPAAQTRKIPVRSKQPAYGMFLAVGGVAAAAILAAVLYFNRPVGEQGDPKGGAKGNTPLVQLDPNAKSKDGAKDSAPKKDDGKTSGHQIDLPPVSLPEIKKSDFKIDLTLKNGKKDANGVVQIVEGEPLQFDIVTDRPAYVGVFYEGDDGQVRQLFPNHWDRDHFLQAGQTYSIPKKGANDAYQIDLLPSTKLEKVTVIGSTTEWKWDAKKARDGYQVFPNFDELTRAVKISINPNSPPQFSRESQPLWVSPQKKEN